MRTSTLHCRRNWERQAWDVSGPSGGVTCPLCSCWRSIECELAVCQFCGVMCFSGPTGGCVLAGWLHTQLQWAEGSEWANSPAETAGTGSRVRLDWDHRRLHLCWQVQSPAHRLAQTAAHHQRTSNLTSFSSFRLTSNNNFLFCYRTETSPSDDECTTMKSEPHLSTVPAILDNNWYKQ